MTREAAARPPAARRCNVRREARATDLPPPPGGNPSSIAASTAEANEGVLAGAAVVVQDGSHALTVADQRAARLDRLT